MTKNIFLNNIDEHKTKHSMIWPYLRPDFFFARDYDNFIEFIEHGSKIFFTKWSYFMLNVRLMLSTKISYEQKIRTRKKNSFSQ